MRHESTAPVEARDEFAGGQTWNTTAYAEHGRFVATMASVVTTLLRAQRGERILDVGCGDGALTEQLAATGAELTGVDASAAMVMAARARAAASPYGFTVEQCAAEAMLYRGEFDAVFSNAALHWIPSAVQPEALAAIHRALRAGGRFVAEMGGQGNIAAIRTALQGVLAGFGIDAEEVAASFFPTPAEYRALLERSGFTVQAIDLHARPTPLPGGADGMTIWLNTFRNGVLDRLGKAERDVALGRTIALLRPVLADQSGAWTADYVRLRFHATRS